MEQITLLLLCLASTGHGRRVQPLSEDSESNEFAPAESNCQRVWNPSGKQSSAAISSSRSDCNRLGKHHSIFCYMWRLTTPCACAAAFATAASLRVQLDAWVDFALQKERKRLVNLQKDAEATKKAEKLGRWANLVVANLYRIDDSTKKIVVEDWENDGKATKLTFNLTQGTPREQADAAFSKVRKLRRGSKKLAVLIEQSHERQQQLELWQARLEEKDGDEDALLTLRKEMLRRAKKLDLKVPNAIAEGSDTRSGQNSSKQATQQAALYGSQTPGWTGREFVSPAGVPILIGRNRQENQQLSLKIAREPDVWMHVRGAPGAHVVLQMSRMKGKPPPSDDCLQMAADLAAFYSEMRDETKVLVSIANPRHITKPKRAPVGAVKILKEEGTIVARPTKSDLIPVELRERRDRESFVGTSVVMSGGGAKRWT